MNLIIDESEDIQDSFLRVLLSVLGQRKTVSAFPFDVFRCNLKLIGIFLSLSFCTVITIIMLISSSKVLILLLLLTRVLQCQRVNLLVMLLSILRENLNHT
jgi:hypothetical protein